VTKEQIEALDLLAAKELDSNTFVARTQRGGQAVRRARANKVWPDYARSLAGAPPKRRGNGPDRSLADHTWCMTAIDWGWSMEDTAKKLIDVSDKAQEKVRLGDSGYAIVTAQNAADDVASNDLKRGGG
jgi:hypothetical protein